MSASIKLYKIHTTGKIGYWECVATMPVFPEYPATLLMKSAGSLDAKYVETTDHIKGKNIGKANETTPYEQALLDMASKARKKMDKGYTESMPAAGEEATNTLGYELPQKAATLNWSKIDKDVDWENAYAQRKIDGHRALVKNGIMYSSGGKPITTLPQFKGLGSYLHLDGELYLHGKSLQEIGKLVKKYRPGQSEKIEYHVFDIVSPNPFLDRYISLEYWFTHENKHSQIKKVETFHVGNASQLRNLHNQFIAEGYEGTMLRQGKNGYKGGARSKDIMKIKDMADAEYLIVDVIEGKPETVGNEVFKVAIFVCYDKATGDNFNVLSHGTRADKHNHMLNRDTIIGKKLTVQHFGFTDKGLPNLPVAKCFREDL
jgi:DNA ligase-1